MFVLYYVLDMVRTPVEYVIALKDGKAQNVMSPRMIVNLLIVLDVDNVLLDIVIAKLGGKGLNVTKV